MRESTVYLEERKGNTGAYRWIWPFVMQVPPAEKLLPGVLGQLAFLLLLGQLLLEAPQAPAVFLQEVVL